MGFLDVVDEDGRAKPDVHIVLEVHIVHQPTNCLDPSLTTAGFVS
jgi:hypothetical protein